MTCFWHGAVMWEQTLPVGSTLSPGTQCQNGVIRHFWELQNCFDGAGKLSRLILYKTSTFVLTERHLTRYTSDKILNNTDFHKNKQNNHIYCKPLLNFMGWSNLLNIYMKLHKNSTFSFSLLSFSLVNGSTRN